MILVTVINRQYFNGKPNIKFLTFFIEIFSHFGYKTAIKYEQFKLYNITLHIFEFENNIFSLYYYMDLTWIMLHQAKVV